mgnify:FL=1|jgi:hypothetical protein|tara:strand:- start:4 stop:465 length:462 start_codon:yes stop_codon:yes gene_type:complete
MSNLGSSILRNVTLNYLKVDPSKPVSPFGTLQWEVQIEVPEDRSDEIAEMGKLRTLENGNVAINIKRKALKHDGSPNFPVALVDAQKKTIEVFNNIGNGSTGNVKVYRNEYDVAGRQGISTSLSAIQITNLIEYTGSVDFDVESEEVATHDDF